MSRKIQIWLRPDQAECAVSALEYIVARFTGQASSTDQPALKLACKLARERAEEVAGILNEALAKVGGDA